MKLAVVGAGNMGANHARTVAGSPVADLGVVIDRDLVRARAVANQFGSVASVDLERALSCDAVIVASSTPSHADIAIPLIEAGIPVLIEKPLAASPEDVYKILGASQRSDVPVMCGFVERFNPAVATVMSLVDETVVHVHAVRHSPFNPSAGTGVVTDLLIHDIDLAVRFAGDRSQPKVSSMLWVPDGSTMSEVADCVLQFSGGTVANLSSSRWSQRKIRDLQVATDRCLYEIDLLRTTVSVYQHVRYWAEFGDARSYRAETIVDVPFVRHAGEPLSLQLAHFLNLVDGSADADTERDGILAPHDIAALVDRG
jgi:predicted dehydrogenase